MNRVIKSSAFSLALGYVMLGFVALVLFAAPLWYAWQVTIQDGRAEILKEDAQRLTEIYRRDGAQGLTAFIEKRVSLQIAGERILLFADSSLKPLAGNLPAWPLDVPEKSGIYTIVMNLEGHQTRAVLVSNTLPGEYHLLVGRDLARFAPLETRFWYGLSAATAILAIVGVLGGLLIRRAILSRINSIGQTASVIMRGDLSHRLPARYSGDELDTLSLTFNRMLDQIEQSVNGIRNVSNAIAHDLRTPLAELRSRLEELVVNRPAANETFAELEAAVTDVDRVINIFNALLRLAEIDAGLRRSGFVQVDTAKMVAQVVEFYLPAAELRGITLSLRQVESVPVSGDPLLLTQAVTNLLDNALKFVHDNGTITIDVYRWSEETVGITVADDGPGIPDAEKPKVVERFYRGDTSRGTPGVGLGLTLVAAIARLHEGTLEFVDNYPGLRAYLVIAIGSPFKSAISSMTNKTESRQQEKTPLLEAHKTPVLDG